MDKIYDMKLGETIAIDSPVGDTKLYIKYRITRVPMGWIFVVRNDSGLTSVFVPLANRESKA